MTARERTVVEHTPYGAVASVETKPSPFEKLEKPKDEHVKQAMLYSWLTTQEGFVSDRLHEPLAKMPKVMILYFAKDLAPDWYARHPDAFPPGAELLRAPFKAFTVEAKPRMVSALLGKVRGIWEALDAGLLPSREYHHTKERGEFACMDCPWNRECYAEEGYFDGTEVKVPARIAYARELIGHPLSDDAV
jgi:hypothetical protein